MKTELGSKQHKKLETQLNHLLERVNRVIPRTADEQTKRADLLAKILALMIDLEGKCEEVDKLQQSISAEVSILANQTLSGL